MRGATPSGNAQSPPAGGASPGGRPWAKGLTAGRSFGGRAGASATPGFKPGQLYLFKDGKLVPTAVLAGITDGSMTEVKGADLQEGALVVIGTEVPQANRGNALTPPPGMGGPQFRGPGGRR